MQEKSNEKIIIEKKDLDLKDDNVKKEENKDLKESSPFYMIFNIILLLAILFIFLWLITSWFLFKTWLMTWWISIVEKVTYYKIWFLLISTTFFFSILVIWSYILFKKNKNLYIWLNTIFFVLILLWWKFIIWFQVNSIHKNWIVIKTMINKLSKDLETSKNKIINLQEKNQELILKFNNYKMFNQNKIKDIKTKINKISKNIDEINKIFNK